MLTVFVVGLITISLTALALGLIWLGSRAWKKFRLDRLTED